MMPVPPILIFLHLPKTGGRTLTQVIRRQYRQNAILALYASTRGDEVATLPRHRVEHLRVVMGHLYFGVHTFVPSPTAYFTLLRDPVDRVISHYYFVRTDPAHYLYDAARRLSLRDYVISCGANEPNNDQTRLLAGSRYAADPGAHPNQMLATAKRNLHEHFAVVGLTEEFDRSLLLMRHVFGWRKPFYARRNATRYRPRKEEIPQDTMEVIEAYNKVDIELYQHSKALFHEQLVPLADDIEAELRTFRVLNRSVGRLRLSLSSAIARVTVSQ